MIIVNQVIMSLFGLSSSEIMARERSAVNNALVTYSIPTPSGAQWDAICAKYPEVTSQKVDEVLSKVTLPSGWSVTKDPSDPYGRCCLIIDHTGEKVGSTFLKDTGYDYYGSCSFSRTQLVKLGIISTEVWKLEQPLMTGETPNQIAIDAVEKAVNDLEEHCRLSTTGEIHVFLSIHFDDDATDDTKCKAMTMLKYQWLKRVNDTPWIMDDSVSCWFEVEVSQFHTVCKTLEL